MNTILSIVIVEFHSANEIQHCFTALKQHLSMPFEIIVSSNSCYSKEERKEIDQADPQVKWLFNHENGGFAYAMNEGLKVAKGKYMAIMNSDCILNSDLQPMISFMEQHKDVGAIAPKMHDADGNIQDTARPYVSLPRYVWRQTKRVLGHQISILDRKMDYDRIQTVDWLIGAFIMVSRSAYEATGGLDGSFFMYAEDLDWCTRIRQHGFEVVYYPEVTITYKGTRRARSNSKYAKIFISSHITYWKKFGFFYGYPPRKEMFF
ncbi:MAG: glycosyltransferase family 2 protein [Prevotella sp.]|nr:glycosyltransferase family 2 protein [Prevotella sp.]